jgi:hypothetical protein
MGNPKRASEQPSLLSEDHLGTASAALFFSRNIIMNREAFYAALRGSALFPHGLSEEQVRGCEALLNSCMRNKISNLHHVANIFANVHHETGAYMLPIKETVYASHKDKNPSDATVKARLEAAWKAGKLSWVKTPYWRDGAFGRGPIQITHWSNYDKMGKRLGVDIRRNPSLALDPDIGADIAVVGMSEGMFTTKKLSDYQFPASLKNPPDTHPRRIVNGKDGTDDKISAHHPMFYAALVKAGYSVENAPPTPPIPGLPHPIDAEPAPIPAHPNLWTALAEMLKAIFARKP